MGSGLITGLSVLGVDGIFFINGSAGTLFLYLDHNLIGFFTNSPQYKNANIGNFVLAVRLERNWTKEVCNSM